MVDVASTHDHVVSMLLFLQESVRSRVLFVANVADRRYELEYLKHRWFVRVLHRGQVSTIGEADGYQLMQPAIAAAEADAEARVSSKH